jgi:DNA-binding NarL/FixJ family response regulator
MKILVVDDHPLIQEGLRHVLRTLDPAIESLECMNCAEALDALSRHPDINLILLDLTLPGTSGMDALALVRDRAPGVPVVVLSATEDPKIVVDSLERGAMGFIPKTSSNDVLLGALRLVFAGGVYVPRQALAAGGHETLSQPASAQPDATAVPPRMPADLGLTPRQADVLALLLQGKPNKLISRELNLSEGTVKVHLAAVFKALGVSNRTQVVIAASRVGLRLPQMVMASAVHA